MRIQYRRRLILVLLVAGPTALILFAQLRDNIAPVRFVQDPYPVFADLAVDPDANIVTLATKTSSV